MGYTDVTMDGTADITVGQTFRDNLGSGHTMAWIWYQANTEYESDRWRIFIREGSTIADYNPSNIPDNKDLPAASLTVLNGKVTVATELLSDTRSFESQFAALSVNHYAIAEQDRPISEVYRKGPEFLAKTETRKASAIAVAQKYIGNSLPADAVLEYVIPITASVDKGPKMNVAYAVRYMRELDGLAIRSNSWKHHYEIIVNGNQVAYTSRLWPDIRVEESSGPDALEQILSVDQAVYTAADNIAAIVKRPVRLVSVEPCYANSGNEIVPAYAFGVAGKGYIIVDVRTGDVVR
jgi:hypothetical protein